MTAAALLGLLDSLGVELQTDGARLRWRPAGAVRPELRGRILAHRDALITLLTGPTGPTGVGPAAGDSVAAGCPSCRQPLDGRGRCWRCCDRLCSRCGRQTGTAFIELCCACGQTWNGNLGEPL